MHKMRLGIISLSLALIALATIAISPVIEAKPLQDSITIENPYVGGIAFKGQLHSHTESCTAYELEVAYRDNGFDFISITDHDYWTPDPDVPGILHIDGIEQTVNEGHTKIVQAISATGSTLQYVEANHPNRLDNAWTREELAGNTQIMGLEVFNPKHVSESEDKWDYALLKPYKRAIWGSAVDDYHGTATFSGGEGWVIVYAPSLTAIDILNSLQSGNFYPTTGATMETSLSGRTITVLTEAQSTIVWKKRNGNALKTTSAVFQDSYECRGNEVYVRAVITRDSDGKKAWTQPFFVNRSNGRGR